MTATMRSGTDGRPILAFATPNEWEAWLECNGVTASGIWIEFAKRDSGIASINYAQALDVALCFGWIDGQAKSLGKTKYIQRFTPRGRRSIWSKINCAKAEALIAQKAMRAAGLAQVEAAKSDGRWERAYEGQRNMTVPHDFEARLATNGKARDFFATLDSRNRYAILFRIHEAKTPETRTRRIEKFMDMLARGETLH